MDLYLVKLILLILLFLKFGRIFLLLNFNINDEDDGVDLIVMLIKLGYIFGLSFFGILNWRGWNWLRIFLEGIGSKVWYFVGLKYLRFVV